MREIDDILDTVLQEAGLEWVTVAMLLSERVAMLEERLITLEAHAYSKAIEEHIAEPEAKPKKVRVSLPAKANGRYCIWCAEQGVATPLTGKQRYFCSQADAGRWTGSHKGETPEALFRRPETTVVAGEGVRE